MDTYGAQPGCLGSDQPC